MLRAMWRALETALRQLLNGHEEGNLGYKPRRSLRGTAPVLDPTTAGVLHGACGDPRFAADAALPQSGGATDDADEEPHRWSAHGNRDRLQQGTVAWQSVLQRVVRELAGSASLSGGAAPAEPGTGGVLRYDPAAAAAGAQGSSGTEPA